MWICVYLSLGCYMTESHDWEMFNFLRNCQTVFQSGCIILCSHQQYLRVPVSPHLHQHLLLFALLIIAILVDMCEHLLFGLGVGGWREQKVPTELRKYLEMEKRGRKIRMSNGSVCDRVIYPQGGVWQIMSCTQTSKEPFGTILSLTQGRGVCLWM